jgi:hypothetical protein
MSVGNGKEMDGKEPGRDGVGKGRKRDGSRIGKE